MKTDPDGRLARRESHIVSLAIQLRLARDCLQQTMNVLAGVFVHGEQVEPKFESCGVRPMLNLRDDALIASSTHFGKDSHWSVVARLVSAPTPG